MLNLKTKLATGIATGAVLANALLPLAAADSITLSGNGVQSDNTVTVNNNSSTTVNQQNNATVTNTVTTTSNTGGNEASRNTGDGLVDIDTGDASSDVTVHNAVNVNSATVDCCGNGDLDLEISKNGDSSDNTIRVNQGGDTTVRQDNDATVKNTVTSDNRTGNNTASRNTGDGEISITTGNASATVALSTTANVNSATVGGEGDEDGDVSLSILGNGVNSDNRIRVDFGGDTLVRQDNDANVTNTVDVDGRTGGNEANRNTGDGDVSIDTGDASADITVDNLVNFNAADLNCGCHLGGDLDVEVSKNGDSSDNSIRLNYGGDQTARQDNDANVKNPVTADLRTGNNESSRNTADPMITTGDADSTVEVGTTANANMVGGADFELPDNFPFMGGMSFHLNFDWDAFLDWWEAHQG